MTSLVVAVAVQPRWWAIVLWRPQSSAPLSRLVSPPSIQWMMWCHIICQSDMTDRTQQMHGRVLVS